MPQATTPKPKVIYLFHTKKDRLVEKSRFISNTCWMV